MMGKSRADSRRQRLRDFRRDTRVGSVYLALWMCSGLLFGCFTTEDVPAESSDVVGTTATEQRGEGDVRGAEGAGEAQSAETRPVGAPCGWNVQCAGGVCIPETLDGVATGWVGGHCTAMCGQSACLDRNAACLELGQESYCLFSCADHRDCREGYVCHSEVRACLPDCRRGWSCAELSCSERTGECVDPAQEMYEQQGERKPPPPPPPSRSMPPPGPVPGPERPPHGKLPPG
jgi:hypothetical protein